MISLLITVIAFLLLGTVFKSFNAQSYKGPDNDFDPPNFKHIVKTAVVLIVSIMIGTMQPISVQRIDAGNVGLKIDRIGNSKGIPVARQVKGWVFYNSWATDVVEYSIRQNHVGYKDFTVTTKGGFPMKVSPSFNYSLKPDKAAELYINLLKGGSFSSLEDNFLFTATTLALNNASNKYPIDSIFNNKEGYNHSVSEELNKELSSYFVVTQINPGSVPPPELAEVIKAKTETIQKAQQAELDRITAEAQAFTKIATARGDSAAKVIEAQALALAIRLKQQEITPNYIDYIKWSAWDGKLPTTQLSSGAGVLLQR